MIHTAKDNSKMNGLGDVLRHVFSIFRVKREERGLAGAALLYATVLNAIVVACYWEWFSRLTGDYRKLVLQHFHISGFDPITYLVLNEWSAGYNIYRHPLLAFFMWPFAQLNHLLASVTGINFPLVITALILIFCAFYAAIFLFRTLRECVGLTTTDAHLLTFLFMSFGYTMVATSVPDHFGLSTTALLLTLYVAGKKLKRGRAFTKWQTVLFFLLTAGISLNNGIKVFLANWVVNGRKFWRPANLLLAIIVPSALLWGFARLEWHVFERPNYIARQEAKANKEKKERAAIVQDLLAHEATADTTGTAHAADSIYQVRAAKKQQRRMKKAMFAHQGKPMAKGEFAQWTDITTPRWESIVENVFGEPIQLHPDYVLGDVLIKRPVIVNYRYAASYVLEALIVLFFLVGIWMGRRSRLLWIALSWMGFDAVIHVGLGFGLNEVYIMSPHWLFVLPVAMAYALQRLRGRGLWTARIALAALSLFLLGYNGTLYVQYLLF